ncbi:MAG TPA: septum site-determining protein MinC [Phenylobacterium sp.]|uniref:septum site-determining protein MinC n=1 Tax=Phenylobacterium sp. TaxID=1871053 RepID=UPI002B45E6AA|nr:septum site-determining protein MinC [Phenylobacterium sp.]HKR90460.1 septum site-determining protein MinC [Phenylobacterium sp.]
MPLPLQALRNSPPPIVHVRGRSFMALALAPEPPLAAWFVELDEHLAGAAGLFTNRPMVVDLSLAAAEGRDAVLILLDGLESRGFRIIGLEGASPGLLEHTHWERLPTQLYGREAPTPVNAAPPRIGGELIEGPVRSGQSVVCEAGDVTIVGAVASGAEVIAGGSIHIYGALRGRAIAGIREGAQARIFCSRMEAEMVGVDRLYRTAENWGAQLHGRAVQVRSDRGALRISALD